MPSLIPFRARRTKTKSGAHGYQQIERAGRFLASRLKVKPVVAVVLGSGLDAFSAELTGAVEIPYGKIPHWPRSTVVGHAGRLTAGRLGETPVVIMAGRSHLYEGYSPQEITFPIRVLARAGIRALVLTNAAGGINPGFHPPQLVLISDHINLQGSNPLAGENDARLGPRFPDLSDVYPRRLRDLARQCAREIGRAHGLELPEGVYAAVLGPSFETPAEIRYLRAIGADMVGMSTAPEAIVAAHMGIPVLGISMISNMAAGLLSASPQAGPGSRGEGPAQKITHEEVLESGRMISGSLTALLRKVIPRL